MSAVAGAGTRLYRIVEQAERDDLATARILRIPAGGSEVKEFWSSRDAALRFAEIAGAVLVPPLYLLEVSIPVDALAGLEPIHADGRSGYAVRDTELEAVNRVITIEALSPVLVG